MKRALLSSPWPCCGAGRVGATLFAQSRARDRLRRERRLPHAAVNSPGRSGRRGHQLAGHIFVYTRTGHAVATLGDERTFYHGGSRLFQFDQTGKFVREIGQGVYGVNFAQQVRVDPQDNIWIVDAGSNQVIKFDADGRFQLVLGRKPENIAVRPGPGVSATAADAASRRLAGRPAAGGPRRRWAAAAAAAAGDAGRRASTATASTGRRTSRGTRRQHLRRRRVRRRTTASRSSTRTATS